MENSFYNISILTKNYGESIQIKSTIEIVSNNCIWKPYPCQQRNAKMPLDWYRAKYCMVYNKKRILIGIISLFVTVSIITTSLGKTSF